MMWCSVKKQRHEKICIRDFRPWAVKPQKVARGLKFQMYEVDGYRM